MGLLKHLLCGAIGFVVLFWMAFVLLVGAHIFLENFGLTLLIGRPIWVALTMIPAFAGCLAGLLAWSSK